MSANPDVDDPAPIAPRRRTRRYVTRTAIFVALYFAILVYPVVRLIGLLVPNWTPNAIEWLAIIVGPILGRIVYERYPTAVTRSVAAIALTWLGICFQLFALMIPFELINAFVSLPAETAGLVITFAIVALSVAGFVNTQILHVKCVPIPGPTSVAGRTLVQISDVHIGSRSPRFLARIVARVNALKPDYVLITGDLIDFAGISRAELAPLGTFTAPVIFAIGNHERYVDLAAIDERMRSLGVTVLRDAAVTLGPFQFIGVDDVDSAARIPESLGRIDLSSDHYGVLLYHRPDGFDAAAARGIPLMLAGHTHAGQIIPFNFLVKHIYPRMRGLHELNGSRLYVSPGTGTWGPVLRIGSRSEITLIEFV
jgi:predicted MPP superfamily phosphohydrolase